MEFSSIVMASFTELLSAKSKTIVSAVGIQTHFLIKLGGEALYLEFNFTFEELRETDSN